MAFSSGLLLLLWVVASILMNGIALLHYLTKLRGLELFGYGAGAGVVLHAILGWGIAAAPTTRWAVVGLLIVLTLLSAIYFIIRRVPQEFSVALAKAEKISLGLWALLLLLCLGILHVEVRFPDPLPDGKFVFKEHTTNVKVQYLASFPADNYIPFTVAEFFLRGVSFQKERPILPGNEISNRTILMSLTAMPFRVASRWEKPRPVRCRGRRSSASPNRKDPYALAHLDAISPANSERIDQENRRADQVE